MRKSSFYTVMCYARAFSTLLDVDLETLVAREPKPEDHHVFLEGWG